jgi:hypothetical protein
MNVSKDALWKSIIESLIDDFLRYFFPDYVDQIDFDRGFEFLDTELQKLIPDNPGKKRHADKLIKVWLLSGAEVWFLIHVEVQGYEDETFPERMFQYFYRIRDRYSQSVMAFAILTDANKRYRPKEYRYKFFETEVIYSYHFLKLTDYKPIDFQPNNNLFAIALEVAWHGLQKKSLDDTKLYKLKFDLCRRVLNRGYTFQDFVKLFNFIKFYVSFGNQELFAKFEEEIRTETNTRIFQFWMY